MLSKKYLTALTQFTGDRQAISFLLGPNIVRILDELRELRVTGRSARLLMGIIGEILIHRRNPYLFQELVDSAARRKRLFERAFHELDLISDMAMNYRTPVQNSRRLVIKQIN